MAIYLDKIKSSLAPLLEREFKIASVGERPEVFGNACVVVESAKLAVRFLFDRGQFFADARAVYADRKWYSLEDLLSLISSGGPSCSTPIEAVDRILAHEADIARLVEMPELLVKEGLISRA